MEKLIDKTILSEFEKDALKEIINLAFGDAAGTLADVMGMYVFLNVPVVDIMQPEDVVKYISKELELDSGFNIIEQYYIGKIKGVAFLVMSYENSESIISILNSDIYSLIKDHPIDLLAKETLMEIANIIIGACVSKIAELLADNVVYMPPRFVGENYSVDTIPKKVFNKNSYVIMLKTIFKFESKDINGIIFLVNSYESIKWLKNSINKFISTYV
ncbi:MAG TPA: hypothetical protein HPP56_01905 [Nitrospirae bacterium]|nr:hypothetical protein [Nitrospirota bacterium]